MSLGVDSDKSNLLSRETSLLSMFIRSGHVDSSNPTEKSCDELIEGLKLAGDGIIARFRVRPSHTNKLSLI